MDKDTLQGALPEYFAPWVQALGLRVEGFDADSVTMGCRSTRSCPAWATCSAARP